LEGPKICGNRKRSAWPSWLACAVGLWLILARMNRHEAKPKRQQWASRSPEKLSVAEQQFCLLVARGVTPADALDGIILGPSGERTIPYGLWPNTHAMASKWMKKPKINDEIARLWRIEAKASAERIAGSSRCRSFQRVDLERSPQSLLALFLLRVPQRFSIPRLVSICLVYQTRTPHNMANMRGCPPLTTPCWFRLGNASGCYESKRDGLLLKGL